MTDMIKADGDLIKTDGKGRVRMRAEQREKLLEELERSGISGPQFATVVGVKYQTPSAAQTQEATRRYAPAPPKCPAAVPSTPAAAIVCPRPLPAPALLPQRPPMNYQNHSQLSYLPEL
jgi:hypothetical protein